MEKSKKVSVRLTEKEYSMVEMIKAVSLKDNNLRLTDSDVIRKCIMFTYYNENIEGDKNG